MKIPIYLDFDGAPTFRAYTLLKGKPGYWHLSKGVKGPARVYEADDSALPIVIPGHNPTSAAELVLVFHDGSTKTAKQCWQELAEIEAA